MNKIKNLGRGWRPVYGVAAVLLVGAVGLAACDQQDESLDDAPTGQVDDSPVFVMTNADKFPNIAFRCFGANGIYTTTREYGDAITIVVNDPECPGYNPNVASAVSG